MCIHLTLEEVKIDPGLEGRLNTTIKSSPTLCVISRIDGSSYPIG